MNETSELPPYAHRSSAFSAGHEDAWRQLKQHAEWAEGFWVAFIFSPAARPLHELQGRLREQLAAIDRALRVIHPENPAALRTSAEELLDADSRAAGCVWLEALHVDSAGVVDADAGGPWRSAWVWFLQRLNERRELTQRALSGGLILSGPPALKATFRESAPDLWSIRALLLELAPTPAKLSHDFFHSALLELVAPEAEPAKPGHDLQTHVEELKKLEGRTGVKVTRARATVHERIAEALLRRDETAEALRHAAEAVELREALGEAPVNALRLMANAEVALNDTVAARRHLEWALELCCEDDDETTAWALRRSTLSLARVLETARQPRLEESLLRRALSLRCEALDTSHLKILWNLEFRLARTLRYQRRFEEATEHAKRGRSFLVEIERLEGKSPINTMRLALSEMEIADAQRARGIIEDARAAYESVRSLLRQPSRAMIPSEETYLNYLKLAMEATRSLGSIYEEAGEREVVERLYTQAVASLRAELEALPHDDLRFLLASFLCLLVTLGESNPERSKPLLNEAQGLMNSIPVSYPHGKALRSFLGLNSVIDETASTLLDPRTSRGQDSCDSDHESRPPNPTARRP